MRITMHTRAARWCALWSALALVACGGGGGDGSVGAGGTGGSATPEATVVAPITGFGSVIVGGVRFDDSASSVSSDDGTLSRSDLRLGMMVQVRGSIAADGTTGVASSIRAFSEIKGPIESLTAGGQGFAVMGVTVRVDASTVYANVGSLAGLAVGDFVEVNGLRDPASGSVRATRVERKSASAGDELKSRGIARSPNPTARTFTLGTLTVSFANARLDGVGTNGPSDGDLVTVRASQPPAGGVLVATRVQREDGSTFDDGGQAEVEGIVSSFASIASFRVANVPVDGSNAVFTRGSIAGVVNGARIEVKGRSSGGVLRATQIKVEEGDDAFEAELRGTIDSFTSIASFVVRGQVVDASAATFSDGSASSLAAGRRVEVRGVLQGSIVKATRVKFDD